LEGCSNFRLKAGLHAIPAWSSGFSQLCDFFQKKPCASVCLLYFIDVLLSGNQLEKNPVDQVARFV
jgi:hypothetical protein